MERIPTPANSPAFTPRSDRHLTVLKFPRRHQPDPFSPLLQQVGTEVTITTELTLGYPVYPSYSGSGNATFRTLQRKLQLQLWQIGDVRWLSLTAEQRLAANLNLVFSWLATLHCNTAETIFRLTAIYTEARDNRWDLERILKDLKRRNLLPDNKSTELMELVDAVLKSHQATPHLLRLQFITAKPYTNLQIFTVLLGLGTP